MIPVVLFLCHSSKEASVKKILIAALVVVLILATGLFGYVKMNSKPLPSGEAGVQAEALANEMLAAINHNAWLETGAIRWNFGGRQQHLWDRERHYAKVEWDDITVLINLSTHNGIVYRDGEILDQDQAEYLEQAWAHWANDSFWLNPISKVFDEGTSRQFVTMEDGLRGLLITYTSGGTTPGDSYLWVIDNTGLPVRFDMWVSIIPMGGAEASWEDWTTLDTGVKVAQKHDLGLFELHLTDIKAANTLTELTGKQDPFAALVNLNTGG